MCFHILKTLKFRRVTYIHRYIIINFCTHHCRKVKKFSKSKEYFKNIKSKEIGSCLPVIIFITSWTVIIINDANPNVEKVVCGSQKALDWPVNAVNDCKSTLSIYSSDKWSILNFFLKLVESKTLKPSGSVKNLHRNRLQMWSYCLQV